MANAKISQLPLASTPLTGTEVLPIVQSGVTDQVSVADLTYGRTVDTGNLIVTGTCNTTGNFSVATNKFAVIASSGNTDIAGTLDSAGDFSVATNKFNVTATSGDTVIAGTLDVIDDFAVNTNKFYVTATSGNTTIAGTLDVTDDFAINTNKFNVTATSGNTTVAGTLAVTGLTTVTGGIAGGIQALSGAGAVNVTTLTTNFTSTATGNALTLANGTAGQIKTVIYVAEAAGADTGVLTPTNRLGYATITLNAIGDTVTLQYTGTAWAILSVRGATVA